MKRIPLWFKVLYTAFLCVLVPYYWRTYSPWNFLYFCDMALLITCAGVWLENSLLVSTQAVGIVLPQTLWIAYFMAHLVVGSGITGMTDYMFKADLPLFVRGLSLFHGWLPLVLVWLLTRVGYDRRALAGQTVFGVVLLIVCYVLAPAPPPPASHPGFAVNINYVYGLDDAHAQTWMAPNAWFALLVSFIVVCLYVPAHLAMRWLFPDAAVSVPVAETVSV